MNFALGPLRADVHLIVHTDLWLDLITLVLVLVTGTLAFFTYKLHRATTDLAGDTVDATRSADRHHKESLSPFCVMRKCRVKMEVSGGRNVASIAFNLHNQGNGAAIAVNVRITPVGPGLVEAGVTASMSPGPLAANEESEQMGISNMWPWLGEETAFLVVLEFRSIFETWGISRWNVRPQLCSLLDYQLHVPPRPDQTGPATQ